LLDFKEVLKKLCCGRIEHQLLVALSSPSYIPQGVIVRASVIKLRLQVQILVRAKVTYAISASIVKSSSATRKLGGQRSLKTE